jgi:hypothetical protein
MLFFKTDKTQLYNGAEHPYNRLCDHRSIVKQATPAFIKKEIQKLGFTHIKIVGISYRFVPSVLHVPFAITEVI